MTSRLIFLWPNCTRRSECPPNVVPNSEFRTCPNTDCPNAIHSKFMNTPNVDFLDVPLCSAPMSYLASGKCGCSLCYGHAATRWCLQRGRWCRVRTYVTEMGRLQNVSPLSVLFESSRIFLQYTKDTDAKK